MHLLLNLRDVIRKIFYLLEPKQRVRFFLVLFMTVIGAAFETLGVSAILPLMQALLSPNELLNNRYVAPIIQFLGLQTNGQLISMTVFGIILIYAVKNAYLLLLSYMRASYSGEVQVSIGVRLMKSYMRRGYQFFLRTQSHVLYRGLTGDVSGVYAILYAGFRLISELLTDLAIGILVIYTDPIIALFLLGIGLFLLLFSTFLSKNRMRELGKQYRWCDIRVKAAAYQAFEGIKDVLVMHKQSVFVNRYETWTKKMQRTGVVQNVTSESPIYIFEAVLVAGLMTAIGIRAGMGAADTVFVTKLATIAMAAFRIMPSLGRIANYMNNVMFNVPSLNSCYDKVREVEQNDLKPSAESVEGLVSATPFRNDICLNHVTFRYEGTDVDILKDLNLMIRKGEAIGIIGESGAGKSTVSNLLLGLLRPQKGSVTMDGIDIRSIPEQWCRTIGYVPQSVYILDESIRTNVAFGVDEEDIDDEKVWAAGSVQ